MAGSALPRLAAAVTILALPPAAGLAEGRDGRGPEDYLQLVARYRNGDPEAAQILAAAMGAGSRVPPEPSHGRAECEAAAVLNLETAAVLCRGGREHLAGELLDATRGLLARQASGFAFDWLLAAAALHQAYADHARAFRLYERALDLRPRDPLALLGLTTALEFSAIPDGFGGVGVSPRDIWPFLQVSGEPPSDLAFQLANPRADEPYRRLLLEHLTRRYREVLALDRSLAEARLRLGRVLEERGHRAEAEAELHSVSMSASDAFVVAVARLCLARFETSPEREAAAYRSALDVDPSLGPAWLGLGRALLASGDREGALAAVKHALSPEESRANTAWVNYHLGRGRSFTQVLDRLRARVSAK
jgi:tetratricopeptide (TPR) repeat protein